MYVVLFQFQFMITFFFSSKIVWMCLAEVRLFLKFSVSFILLLDMHIFCVPSYLLCVCSWLVNVCGFKNRGAKLSPVPCYLLIIKDKANAWTVDNTTKGEKSDTVVPSTGKLETFLGCAMLCLSWPHQPVILFVYYVTIFCQKPS